MIEIRKVEPEDIRHVVDIHLLSFRNFFLSSLGAPFLNLFYRSILSDPSGVALLAGSEGRIVGFIFGSTHPAGLYRRLLRSQVVRFAIVALPSFLRNPFILPRLMRAFKMPSRKFPGPKCAMILSIAVDPDFQSRGIGKNLVKRFLSEVSMRGSNMVILDTDAIGNDLVNQFYQSLGFTLHNTYVTPEGRSMNEYLLYL